MFEGLWVKWKWHNGNFTLPYSSFENFECYLKYFYHFDFKNCPKDSERCGGLCWKVWTVTFALEKFKGARSQISRRNIPQGLGSDDQKKLQKLSGLVGLGTGGVWYSFGKIISRHSSLVRGRTFLVESFAYGSKKFSGKRIKFELLSV
jgi:hypothetical protein